LLEWSAIMSMFQSYGSDNRPHCDIELSYQMFAELLWPASAGPLVDRVEQTTLMAFTGGAPSTPFRLFAVEDSKPCQIPSSIAG
jgi:hypothetical protein